MPEDLVVTPSHRIVPRTARLIEQLAKGGFLVGDNSVARPIVRRCSDLKESPSKRIKLDPSLRLVNVEYTFHYSIHYHRQTRSDSQTGFLRNVPFGEVEECVRSLAESFALKQAYESTITGMDYVTEDVPATSVDLMDQRMFGTVLRYHYLDVDANESPGYDCVYQYLLNTRQKLLDLFKEESESTGVTARQVEAFCSKYRIPMHVHDMELLIIK